MTKLDNTRELEKNKVAIKVDDIAVLSLLMENDKVKDYYFKLAKLDDKISAFMIEDLNDVALDKFSIIGYLDESANGQDGYADINEVKDELSEDIENDTRDVWDLEYVSLGYISTEHNQILATFEITSKNQEIEEVEEEVNEDISEKIELAIKRVVDEGILSDAECRERYEICKLYNVGDNDIEKLFSLMKKYDRPVRRPKTLFVQNNLSKIMYEFLSGEHLSLVGPPSTGKNTCVDTIAWLANRPTRTLSCNAQTEKEDLFGKVSFKNMETEYQAGPVVEAMQKGEIMVLDEINTVNQGLVPSMNSILDYRGFIEIQDIGIVESDRNFTVIATLNENLEGTVRVQQATKSRFYTVIFEHLDSIEKILKINIPNYKEEAVKLVDRVYKNLLQNVKSKDIANQIDINSLNIRALIRACKALSERDFDVRTSLIEDLAPCAEEEGDDIKIIAAIDNALRLEK